jgi:hypothetical protein
MRARISIVCGFEVQELSVVLFDEFHRGREVSDEICFFHPVLQRLGSPEKWVE